MSNPTPSSDSESNATPSSSTVLDSCFGRKCRWQLTVSGPVCIQGCDKPSCNCAEPLGGAGNEGDIVETPCVFSPDEPLFAPPLSVRSETKTATTSSSNEADVPSGNPATETILLNVPNVATGKFSGFRFEVRNGFKVCRAIGWTVTLTRNPSGRSESAIVPQTMGSTTIAKQACVAAVTVPEAGTMKQYWVPVFEENLGAVLHTPEWTVIFHKLPSTH